jgi:hypothetical protein
MTIDGLGGVSSRSGAGPLLAPVRLDPLQLTRRGMPMELSFDWAVDCSGLKAGVGVTKKYCRCHRSRMVCDEGSTAAKYIDIVRNLQPQ